MSKWNELKSWAEAVIGLNKTNQWDWVASVEDGRLGKTHTSFALAANPAAILELIAENERMRGALTEIFNHVEGNTEELVRELVNWGTPKVDPNDFYAECDAIKGLVRAALNEEASHV